MNGLKELLYWLVVYAILCALAFASLIATHDVVAALAGASAGAPFR